MLYIGNENNGETITYPVVCKLFSQNVPSMGMLLGNIFILANNSILGNSLEASCLTE